MAKKLSFEESIAKIELTISKLQSGDLELDASIDQFKEGLELINQAQEKLDKATLKVEKIVKDSQGLSTEAIDM